MTDFTYSLVGIAPASSRDDANRLSCALGHDVLPGNTFSVPLSPTGEAPATHYGYVTVCTATFVEQLAGTAQGQWPDGIDFEGAGLTQERATEVLGTLVNDLSPDPFDAEKPILTGRAHFEALIAAQGLQVVVPDEPI